MKVINLLKQSQESNKASGGDNLAYLNTFRAISALEGMNTSSSHQQMLDDLAMGKISKQDYIKARMKSI